MMFEHLQKTYPSISTKLIKQDSYNNKEEIIPKIYDEELKTEVIDWEIPESINFDKFLNDIQESKKNHQITLVEGFLVFNKETINKEFDKFVFVTVSHENFLKRRLDPNSEWPVISKWYVNYVWKAYQTLGKEPNNVDVLKINGNYLFDIPTIFDEIFKNFTLESSK
eukprot:gene11052-3760_t